ncbi:hypothetical protein HG530_010066 [Fusarium avenaceum]|nr:hypothetical protein HG530_010066 [Fusarium avenaceum]
MVSVLGIGVSPPQNRRNNPSVEESSSIGTVERAALRVAPSPADEEDDALRRWTRFDLGREGRAEEAIRGPEKAARERKRVADMAGK